MRRGSRSSKAPPAARAREYLEGSVCRRCGSVFRRKTWRRRRLGLARLAAPRTTCPACRQVVRGDFLGQVALQGPFSDAERREILRRVRHVAERAGFTQPERRLVATRQDAEGITLTTTSQKLAHRIAREVAKAFRGRARYAWSDGDGGLRARWERRAREKGGRPC